MYISEILYGLILMFVAALSILYPTCMCVVTIFSCNFNFRLAEKTILQSLTKGGIIVG